MAQHILGVITQLILLTVVLLLINWIGKKIIKHIFNSNLKISKNPIPQNKMNTIYTIILNIFKYILLFFWIYAILSAIGIPVGTLIAGAGIFSLAIGLGAQGFVSDMVNGFFILLEQQISVGDYINVNGIEGTVTYVGIRTTQLKSFDGTLNFIPNRNITVVSNQSRNDMRALIEIPVSSNSPFDNIKQVIEHVSKELNLKALKITKAPTILGFSNLNDGTLVIQIAAYTKHGEQYNVKNILMKKYLIALNQAGIELPK
ncbi:small-conductance mechanosensitive channel [Companilactobacillus nodensis DSM 19682 = JCM 14932 = NBRC 107160]|uniref:Small-conductance mechanosensitive channel n=1 Tax=Companilactobacillus nodensis DSM 19682 = JCM 14932 = NBRC 107160 TaxID=1423775 RepID=A0A0R1KCE1_9LACO|nr:mechanosensitive ion channel family protein [Companilactobacillus nodensis]KRK81309.1 small-conductance mechanosensitive channel [Companilactobacillus nodensis DSM 19682 = JCM 14932 = NBRC 107160]